jgi:hypothetical protein
MKLVKLIANLGYGSRKEVAAMFREGRITDIDGEVLYADDKIEPARIRVDDEALDPPPGLVLMMNKPVGHTCSTKDSGRIVYDLLPPRWKQRDPLLSTIGRLDRDTSGLLLFTDDGALLHRVISPRSNIVKVYEATLANDLRVEFDLRKDLRVGPEEHRGAGAARGAHLLHAAGGLPLLEGHLILLTITLHGRDQLAPSGRDYWGRGTYRRIELTSARLLERGSTGWQSRPAGQACLFFQSPRRFIKYRMTSSDSPCASPKAQLQGRSEGNAAAPSPSTERPAISA